MHPNEMQSAFDKVELVILRNIKKGYIQQYFYSPLEDIKKMEDYLSKYIAQDNELRYKYKGFNGEMITTKYTVNISDEKAKELHKIEKKIRLLSNSYVCQLKPDRTITFIELVNKFYGFNFKQKDFPVGKENTIKIIKGASHNMESIMSHEIGKRVYGNLLDSIRIYNRMGIEMLIRLNVELNGNPF